MGVSDFVEIILRWALPLLCGALLGVVVKSLHSEKALRKGVQALLRDRIYQAHDYYLTRGEFPISARENVHNLYDQYHALGGNGVCTDLVKEMDALPTGAGK